MATFSTNQVKHLYVAKALDSDLNGVGDVKFANVGDNEIALKYVGIDGKVRSDLINLDKLIYAKGVKASTMAEYLDSSYVACGTAAANQSYILKVIIDSFGSLGEQDKGFIFAEYTAKSDDATKNILAGLAINLAQNAAKAAYNPLINVYVTTQAAGQSLTLSGGGQNAWKVEPNSSASTLASNSLAGIVIEAAEQPWTVGKGTYEFLRFNVTASPIVYSGVETRWATITKGTTHASAAVKNNKKIADLEWFCMGERGDVYRDISWPNSFTFTPLVDASGSTDAYGYDVIELAFYYSGDAEDVQKSPKEIVIAIPAPSSYGSGTESYKILADINTAAGSTVITQVFGS